MYVQYMYKSDRTLQAKFCLTYVFMYYTSHVKTHYTTCSSVTWGGVHTVSYNRRTTHHTVPHSLYMIMTAVIASHISGGSVKFGHRGWPQRTSKYVSASVPTKCQAVAPIRRRNHGCPLFAICGTFPYIFQVFSLI